MAYQLTEQDKLLARQNAMQRFQAQTPTTQKTSGNFLTSLLPTAGGILGGIGGTFFGPGIGTAAGGAAGAGAGKFLQNLLEGKKDAGEGVLGEAALGTLGGIGKGLSAIKGATTALKTGQGLGKAAQALRYGTKVASALGTVAPTVSSGLIGKTGKTLEKLGGKTLGTQSLMTGAQARAKGVNPMRVFSSINKRTGLTNLDDMAEVSKGLTGKQGSMLDMLTREAVGSTNGVNIPNLANTAQKSLDDYGSLLTQGQRDAVLYQANKAGSTMYGASKGSLSSLANPQEALNQANAFRENARLLTSGFNATAKDKQLAKVYNSMASSIETPLYNSPGVSQSIPSLVKSGSDDLLYKAQDLRASGNISQAKAYEKVAKELLGVKDIKELRTFKKDFVDINKIEEATVQAEGARGLSTGTLSGSFKPVQLLSSAIAPKAGGAMVKAGQALQGGIPKLGISPAMKIAGTQLAGRALTGNLPTTQPSTTGMDMTGATGAGGYGTSGLTGYGTSGASALGGATTPSSIYTKEAVAQDIQNDLAATGGANMDKYITLYNFLNPETKETKSAYGRPSSQQYALAASGTSALQSLAGQLSQDEGVLTRTAVPGQNLPIIGGLISNIVGTGEYKATAQNVLDALARARTGAAMTKQEEAFYERMLPRAGDSEQTVQSKIATLQEAFAPFLNYTGTGTTDTDLISQYAY